MNLLQFANDTLLVCEANILTFWQLNAYLNALK